MSAERRQSLRTAVWIGVFAIALWFYYVQVHRLRLIGADEAQPASQQRLMGLDGLVIDLAQVRGEVLVLNAWASWCGPCRSEIPAFSQTHVDLQDRGLRMLGINVEGLPHESVAALQRDLGMTYPGTVPHGELRGTFQPSGKIPQTWLIDREGRLRANHVGPITESALRAACVRLLEETD